MMSKKIFLFFFIAFLATSCQEKEEKKHPHTPVVIKNDEKPIVKQKIDIKKLIKKQKKHYYITNKINLIPISVS